MVHPIPNVPPGEDTQPRYRSGAVARMVRMPVATLRVWERRYRVSAPAATEAGHRLYSAADVQRLALLKQLTELGHAIGAIAHLDMARLHEVATTHASTMASARPPQAPAVAPVPWRVAVVGEALARRLGRATVLHRLAQPLEVIGPFESLDAVLDGDAPAAVDTLLVHAPGLHGGALPRLQRVAEALGARRIAMLYGYAAAPVAASYAAAGVALLREPQADPEVAQWLRDEVGPRVAAPTVAPLDVENLGPDAMLRAAGQVPARRYDDATLADFAGLSSTIACECPRHVAELLMQLSHFETYTAECASRSPADAQLHAYLGQVVGASRSLFETALERVAIHEGLVLPK